MKALKEYYMPLYIMFQGSFVGYIAKFAPITGYEENAVVKTSVRYRRLFYSGNVS